MLERSLLILTILIIVFAPITLAQTNPPNTVTVENLSDHNKHYLVFDQVGQMAASTTYLHAVLPIKLSSLAEQAQPLFQQFNKMQTMTTKNLTHILFCKNMKEMGQVFEGRLLENLKQLKALDDILPHDSPSFKSGKNKRVPFLWIIPAITGAAWFAKTVAIVKGIAGVTSFATVIGTAAHLIKQSNYNTELTMTQIAETKAREQELDELLKTYRKRLETTPAPRIMTPHADLADNERAIRDLHDSIREAEKIIPPSYKGYFDFDSMVPKPPPSGWKEHEGLIKAYTSDLKNVNVEIRKQIETLKENPYITKSTNIRLTRDAPQTKLDEFMDFFLSLTAWDHQPLEFPNPAEGKTEEFLSRVESERHPRRVLPTGGISFSWGSLATIVGGTFLGMYSSVEVGLIKAKIGSLENAHNLLVHLTKQHDIFLSEITQDLDLFRNAIELMLTYDSGVLYARLDRIVSQWEARVAKIVNALQQAHNGRLAIDFLTPTQLQLLHQSSLELAAENNVQLLPQQPSDYLQLEVSYARSGQEVLLIVHIPCVAANNLLSVYKFVPFPFPLPKSAFQTQLSLRHSLFPTSSDTNEDLLPELDPSRAKFSSSSQALYLDMDANMIAINKDHQYKIVTDADLAGCLQRNHVFLCEQNNVLRTDLRDTCLGSLYFRSAEGVRSHCRFERRRLTEEVYQTGPSSFLVFSPESYATKVECSNGTLVPIFVNQVTRLTIPPQCQATLKTHLLKPTEHIRLENKALVSDWELDPLDLPADLMENGPYIDFSLHKLATSIQKLKTVTSHLDSENKQLRAETKSAYWQLSSDAALDTEFESLLIKQMQTPSVTAIVFWFCFSIAVLGCLGSAIFYFYYSWTTRKYPSLVDALESMQELVPIRSSAELITDSERSSTIERPIRQPRRSNSRPHSVRSSRTRSH